MLHLKVLLTTFQLVEPARLGPQIDAAIVMLINSIHSR